MNAQLKPYPQAAQPSERRERSAWHSAPRIREFGTGYGRSDGYAQAKRYSQSSYVGRFNYL